MRRHSLSVLSWVIGCLVLLLCAEAEGRRPLIFRPRPKGDFVCANIETVFNCSYDQPDIVLNVLWNIPGQSNIDLSDHTTGHVVNYAMMKYGYVTVRVANMSDLQDFYECSVLYNSSRLIESSLNSSTPKQVPNSEMEIMTMSVSDIGWQERRFTWEPPFSESECIEMWLTWQSGASGGSERASHTGRTLSDLPISFNIDGSIEVMANGECISNTTFTFNTSKECWVVIGIGSVVGLCILVFTFIGVLVCVVVCRRPRNEGLSGAWKVSKSKVCPLAIQGKGKKSEKQGTDKDAKTEVKVKSQGNMKREPYEEADLSSTFPNSPTSRDGLLDEAT